MKNETRKKDLLFSILITVFSFALLFFCSASSPRYAINPWDDANAFFTVGKAMANGIIPYKDIFEQKGPLLYLIHCLAYFISKTSFAGVYVFESVFLAAFTFYIYKTAKLFVGEFLSFIAGVLTLTVIVNTPSFYIGDSAEEFSLPFLAFGLYHFVRYFKDSRDKELSKKVYLAGGFFAGCIAMIKFTVIGMWFGWMAIISIHTLAVRKQVKQAFINAFVFIGGMILAFIPWVIYFGVNGAFKDFINVYFIINATAYAGDNSFIVQVLDIIYAYRLQFSRSPVSLIAALLGAVAPVIFGSLTDGKIYSRLAFPVLYGITVFCIYYGGRTYPYYFLPSVMFVCILIITVFHIISDRFTGKKEKKSSDVKGWLAAVGSVVICAGIVASAFALNPVSKKTIRDKDLTYQKKISDYINEHNPDGTILCYGSLDLGVYLFDDYTKLFKHFEHQNIYSPKYTENSTEQDRYVEDHEAYFVVCGIPESKKIEDIPALTSALKNDYTQVMVLDNSFISGEDLSQKMTKHVYLFELNENFR